MLETSVRREPSVEQRLEGIEAQMGQISAQLERLLAIQRPMAELGQELGPIASEVMDVSIKQLDHLQRRGYFAFLRQLQYLVERIVEDYDPDDLRALADNAANILDTVKMATQPEVLAVVRDAVEVFQDGRDPQPLGLLGALRKVRREKDVRRGIGFALDLLGRVGRGISRAPRTSRARGGTVAALPSRTSSAALPSKPTSDEAELRSTNEFQLIDDAAWTESYAANVAEKLGVGELTEAHWVLIRFARADYAQNGSAPNIRRITTQTGVSTREVFTLFPRAPGLTISQIAGIPKPAGCL